MTLKGTLDYWCQRKSAEEAVTHLTGVRYVNNEIVIAPPVRPDRDLHQEIKSALLRRFPFEDIDVTVNRGVAVLMGKVPSYRIRRDAENLAWGTTGIKTVTNKIEITG